MPGSWSYSSLCIIQSDYQEVATYKLLNNLKLLLCFYLHIPPAIAILDLETSPSILFGQGFRVPSILFMPNWDALIHAIWKLFIMGAPKNDFGYQFYFGFLVGRF